MVCFRNFLISELQRHIPQVVDPWEEMATIASPPPPDGLSELGKRASRHDFGA